MPSRTTKLPIAFASCSVQSVLYGKCIGESYTDVKKGMCDKEFREFRKCFTAAMKK